MKSVCVSSIHSIHPQRVIHREINFVADIVLSTRVNALSDHARSRFTGAPFNLDFISHRFSSFTIYTRCVYCAKNEDAIVLGRTSAMGIIVAPVGIIGLNALE